MGREQDADVWAGLEDVGWAGLEHAYGSAADVPECLRQLRDPRREIRKGAQWALYGSLYHQGSRYPASAAAIPFLIRLAADPRQPDRAWILTYVAHLICGGMTLAEDPWLCDGERLCQGSGDGAAAGPRVVAWGEAGAGMAEGPKEREQRAEIEDWLRCYRAAEGGLSVYLEAALSAPTEVRVAALYLLACFYPRRGQILPVLRARLAGTAQAGPPGVRLALLFALGRLGAGAEPEIRARLTDPDAPTRLVAAAAQLWAGEPGGPGRPRAVVGAEVVRVLTGVLEIEELETPGNLPFLRDPAQEAAGLLLHLPSDQLQSARAALRGALARSQMFGAVSIARALLRADFSEVAEETTLTELSPAQRETLRALVEHGDLWTIGNIRDDFAAYGIPFNREEAAALVGGDPRWQGAWRREAWRQKLRDAEMVLDQFGDPARALEILVPLLEAHAGAAPLWALIGRALIGQAQAGGELSAAQRAEILAALDPEAAAAWARAAAEEGAAAASVLRALALGPADGAAWGTLGMLRAEQDHPEAAEAFGRAADLGYQRSVTRQNQAILTFDRGEEAEALRLLEREVAAHPEDENMWYHLGLMRCKAGAWARSAEAISRALVLDPGRANSWYTRACAAARLGWRYEALSDVAEALRLSPGLASEMLLDDDFASLRADPGFLMLLQQGQAVVA